MKHLLSIEKLAPQDLRKLIDHAVDMKTERGHHSSQPLKGQTWAMIFAKSSTRTRVSFEVGIRELGGAPMFLSKNDIQLGRGEPIKDMARVLGRMVHGCIIRTFDQQDVEDFAHYANIPTINALTDEEHPCQIIADLMTVRETLGSIQGKRIAFVGDCYSNMSVSWMWAAKHLGHFELLLAGPEEHLPSSDFLKKLDAPNVKVTSNVKEAVKGAHVINTDVWLSMGQEDQAEKEARFGDYQVNSELMALAASKAIVLHCLPAYRGKEIAEDILEAHADTIFTQAENRLHAQKAVLVTLVDGWG